MSSAPVVSIVTPAFNQAAFIRATVDSVLTQTYPHIEYRVINDGSTDTTEDVLRSYGDKLTWETQPNRGQTATINRGWSLARGDILAWLNSDDTLLPDAVEKAVAYLAAHDGVDILYGRTVFTDVDGRRLPGAPAGRPIDYKTFVRTCENPIPQPSTFLRARVHQCVGDLDESLYYFMDWDYWLRAGLDHSFGYIDEVLSTYRLHDESKTVAGQVRAAPELERIYRTYFSKYVLPADITAFRAEAMSSMHFTVAGYLLRGGESKRARRAAWDAVRAWPPCLLTRGGWRKFLYGALGRSTPYVLIRRLRTGRGVSW